MKSHLQYQKYPELFFGVCGPIGIDIESICESLQNALHSVSYSGHVIKITDETKKIPSLVAEPRKSTYFDDMNYKMDHAGQICRDNEDTAYLMLLAISAIRRKREELHKTETLIKSPTAAPNESGGLVGTQLTSSLSDIPRIKTAYVIRQLKRPEEVALLRNVYGKQFVLVSAYGAEPDRREILRDKVVRTEPVSIGEVGVADRVEKLINKDASEDADEYGQNLRETFHLADVFIDGMSKTSIQSKINRFIDSLFGKNEISPTKVELGMYAAKSASLRSSDLSRQVGAALFSVEGELISQGCNEVPRAFGGAYWDTEEPDYRDIKIGHDPNDILKREVLRDLLERLTKAGILAVGFPIDGEFIDAISSKNKDSGNPHLGCLDGSMILDLTEFGRVVHAEMAAICDAARTGRSIKGSVLFCTTFPCHNCTKHILAAGVSRVYFLEPYPKSKAKELHGHEIELDRPSQTKVSLVPFLGISPLRYRDLFEKRKRKTNGRAKVWYHGEPSPMINVATATYIQEEKFAEARLTGGVVSEVDGDRFRTG